MADEPRRAGASGPHRLHRCAAPSLVTIVHASQQRSSVTASGSTSALPPASGMLKKWIAMRGVALSYETVREWCLKFGQTYANGLRHKSPFPGDRWHLDEVFLKINGRLQYLWRAVDQDGDVFDNTTSRSITTTGLRIFISPPDCGSG